MKTGMLWFDNDPKTDLSSKIDRAALYYRNKYGKRPDLCFIHPTMLPTIQQNTPARQMLAGVEVRINNMVMPNHLWIGLGE